jgi:carbohydrate-selective porin OprB
LAQVDSPPSSDLHPEKASDDLVSIARQSLQDLNRHGVTLQGLMVYDWSKTLVADEDSVAGFGRYSFDLSMALDGKRLFGLNGSAGMIRLKHHLNNFGETYDDEAQLYSNIDAPSRTTLYEIWVEQRLFSDKLRLKGGKIDANTEFAAVQSAGDFLNSSMGYSPTIMVFPTYPEPKLGINAFLRPTRNYGLGMGVFETAGLGTLSIVEPGSTWNLGKTEHPGRISLGYWRLDGKVARFDGEETSRTQGLYSVVEQSVWRQSLGQEGERKLSTFIQAGWADGRVSSFTRHLSGGVVLQGPFRKRSQDGIGVAATWLRFSSDPDADFNLHAELTFESYYKASLTKHIALVSDFQYLHHPGGMRANPDCPVITPRLVLSF